MQKKRKGKGKRTDFPESARRLSDCSVISVAEDVASEDLVEDFHGYSLDDAVLCRDGRVEKEEVEEEEERKGLGLAESEFSVHLHQLPRS